MVQQLERVDDRDVLVIDRTLMEQLGLKAHGSVELAVRDGVLFVTPASETSAPVSFESALDQVMQERSDVLRRLAQ